MPKPLSTCAGQYPRAYAVVCGRTPSPLLRLGKRCWWARVGPLPLGSSQALPLPLGVPPTPAPVAWGRDGANGAGTSSRGQFSVLPTCLRSKCSEFIHMFKAVPPRAPCSRGSVGVGVGSGMWMLRYGCASFTLQPLSVTLQPPSVTLQPPLVSPQPPSVTLQPPSITLQPSSWA